MNDLSNRDEKRGRSPLRKVLGGCAILLAMMLCALVVNAVYWVDRMGVLAGGADSAGATPIALEALPTGNAAGGESLFRGEAACYACHSLEPGETGVGPSLAGLVSRAAADHTKATAEAYILESIVNPDAHIVEGFNGGVMSPNYGQRLSPQQLADLTAFLMAIDS
jgi:mono/diheme cytochrome c family protein